MEIYELILDSNNKIIRYHSFPRTAIYPFDNITFSDLIIEGFSKNGFQRCYLDIKCNGFSLEFVKLKSNLLNFKRKEKLKNILNVI